MGAFAGGGSVAAREGESGLADDEVAVDVDPGAASAVVVLPSAISITPEPDSRAEYVVPDTPKALPPAVTSWPSMR